MLFPRTSSALVMATAKDVTINDEKVKSLASKLLESEEMGVDAEVSCQQRWNAHALDVRLAESSDRACIDWIFLVDALNFSFWSSDQLDKYSVSIDGVRYTGYWSLCAAVNRAIKEGIPFTDSSFYVNITMDQLKKILRSDNEKEMPMVEERLKVLHEIGTVLQDKFSGTFLNCIKEADGSSRKLLEIIVNAFPCFKDEAIFNDQPVSFYKRAQILIADIWACFGGKGLGQFVDIDGICMFADYRIPQALAYFGVLEYSDNLMKLLREDHMFSNGDPMECELRAGSILAVDQVVEHMKSVAKETNRTIFVNAIILDHFLWDYRRKFDSETASIPFHKVRCIYY